MPVFKPPQIFKRPDFPDRPYFATRKFVLDGYSAKRMRRLGFILFMDVCYFVYIIFTGTAQFWQSIGVAIVALFLTPFVFLLLRLGDILLQDLAGRQYIERCVEYLKKYDRSEITTIEKMAETDAASVQISTNMGNTTLGVGIAALLANNL